MVVEQIIDIPDSRQITLNVPLEVPTGRAQVKVIPFVTMKNTHVSALQMPNKPDKKIDEIRQLVQKEMAEKGTAFIKAESGDGWEAHVKERYAQS